MKQKLLLTDFTLPRWSKMDLSSVRECLGKLDTEILGELGHPIDSKYDIISEDNVAVKISNISMDENNCIYGDVETLDTEKGKIAEHAFNNGGRLSIRANAKGNRFTEIITWDVV